VESYRTEEEQLEALKRWWAEHGRSTLIAIVVALGVGFGWQGWQARRGAEAEAASMAYQGLLAALGDREGAAAAESAREQAVRLKSDYPDSAYAAFAALHLARLAMAGGALEDAEAELRWVLAQTGRDDDVHRVARLRLARVLAARGAGEEALQMLAADGDNPYAAAYALARGDVLLAAGREAEARGAYREAQALAETAAPPGLAQKIEYLNPQPPSAAAES
jgi:predicted negative regulator of RcsB-dependent stress response